MRSKNLGLTLLELMTVVAIVGITVALAVANYDATAKRQRGINAAREIASEMQRARKLAFTSAQPIRFVVKDVVVSGVTRRVARWEKLPCNDAWARDCPSTACKSAVCSYNFMGVVNNTGCVCNQVGNDVEIPYPTANTNGQMTIDWEASSATDGICFEPGTGLAHLGWRCNLTAPGADPLVQPTNLRVDIQNETKRYLLLDDATGSVRLFDCGAYDQSWAPAGGCP